MCQTCDNMQISWHSLNLGFLNLNSILPGNSNDYAKQICRMINIRALLITLSRLGL